MKFVSAFLLSGLEIAKSCRLVIHGREVQCTYPSHATCAAHFAALTSSGIRVSFSMSTQM